MVKITTLQVIIFSLFIFACNNNDLETNSLSLELDTIAKKNMDYNSQYLSEIPDYVSSVLKLPKALDNYSSPIFPSHFNTSTVGSMNNTPKNNNITDEIASLGRVLFYEKQISSEQNTACASCHIQSSAFASPDQFSLDFQGIPTERNTMSLINIKYYENGRFYWDERAKSLEDLILDHIQNDLNLGLTLEQAASNITEQTYYLYLFEQAFGESPINAERIAIALSQFVRSILSYQSKYDEGITTNFNNFNDSEMRGLELFYSDRTFCSTCHINSGDGNIAIFQGDETHNNGLDATIYDDSSVYAEHINSNKIDHFKTSSLRNIELTAPYMHDGRFATLLDVIEHYDSGIQPHPNLSPQLKDRDGNPIKLNLNDQQKEDVIAFLLTLTDFKLINDSKFSNPFKHIDL